MEEIPDCTKCGSKFTYKDQNLFICPECGNEWMEKVESEENDGVFDVKDAHGNILKDGDDVTIIKDIKVKGSSSVIKVGVKVKNIRIVDAVDGHNIDARVPGFGSMMLKSEIVKKST